jgi:carbon-monoxide dehydrogenase large subunit
MGYDAQCQPITATLADYLLISSTETPVIDVLHMESPSPLNPLGVKGVGECGVLPVAPALVSAIEDALSPFGVKISRTPIFPHEIVAAVQAGFKGGPHAAAL